jgi:hypothetical protein
MTSYVAASAMSADPRRPESAVAFAKLTAMRARESASSNRRWSRATGTSAEAVSAARRASAAAAKSPRRLVLNTLGVTSGAASGGWRSVPMTRV